MYDIRRQRVFQTVGELRAMLNHLPASTRVSICGNANCFYHEEHDGSLICLDCEDLHHYYAEALEAMLAEETQEERDRHLESLWAELADVPMDPEAEVLEAPFYAFPAGARRADIWCWFDELHSKGVKYLLNGPVPFGGQQDGKLAQFIKEEVPMRLQMVFDLPNEALTDSLVQECEHILYSNIDDLLNYCKIDDMLEEVLKARGIREAYV